MRASDDNGHFHFFQQGHATCGASASPNNWFQIFAFGPQQRALDLPWRVGHKINRLLTFEHADHIFKSQIAFGLWVFLARQHPRSCALEESVNLF